MENASNPYLPLLEKQQAYFKAHLQTSTARQRIQTLKRLKKWILDHQQDIRDVLHKDFKKPMHEVDLSEILPVVMEIKDAIKAIKMVGNEMIVLQPEGQGT